MRAVVQRVDGARVVVAGEVVGAIDRPGLVALVGVRRGDTATEAATVARKIAELRILNDEESCADAGAPVLVVSQFTLYADCRRGNRPSFTKAGSPDSANALYERFVERARRDVERVETGEFGADMQVSLLNDGPVTIPLRIN